MPNPNIAIRRGETQILTDNIRDVDEIETLNRVLKGNGVDCNTTHSDEKFGVCERVDIVDDEFICCKC